MSWELLERTIYRLPDAPSRVRQAPMQVLCVGFPRTGTESLQQALIKLGYDYTYHGWDILFERPVSMPGWVGLARKKFKTHTRSRATDGDCTITAAEFDTLIGHCTAVTDAAGSVFAAELIQAYPEAKVVLNIRRDEDAWHQSACQSLVDQNSAGFWITSFFCAEMFWAWHVYQRFLWPSLFRAQDGNLAHAIYGNGRWVYREHNNMIRGLVSPERLLEWSAEDGWEPLCKFLGKEVPDEEFPHANTRGQGFKERVDQISSLWVGTALRNMAITAGVVTAGATIAYRHLR